MMRNSDWNWDQNANINVSSKDKAQEISVLKKEPIGICTPDCTLWSGEKLVHIVLLPFDCEKPRLRVGD